MKKPKITEGKWIYDGVTCVFTNDNDDEICQLEEYYGEFKNEQDANGKAISAVPEMIESLMGVMHAIEECRLDNGGVALGDVLEEKVKSSLIKAGVFDD